MKLEEFKEQFNIRWAQYLEMNPTAKYAEFITGAAVALNILGIKVCDDKYKYPENK